MAVFVVRVWIPDRPGALGAVASRIGSVRGDVVGVEIIDRGAGRAVDEITVELAEDSDSLIDLLVAEVGQVDGVDVEHVRRLGGSVPDPAVAAMEAAAALVDTDSDQDRFEVAVEQCRQLLAVDWAAVVVGRGDEAVVAAASGDSHPGAAYLGSLVSGAAAGDGFVEFNDLALAPLPHHDGALVMSRAEVPLRGRERDLLLAMARLTDRLARNVP